MTGAGGTAVRLCWPKLQQAAATLILVSGMNILGQTFKPYSLPRGARDC